MVFSFIILTATTFPRHLPWLTVYNKVKICVDWLVGFMVFNATFNNISIICWQSVLLVEETGGPEKTTDLLRVTDKLYHIMMYTLP